MRLTFLLETLSVYKSQIFYGAIYVHIYVYNDIDHYIIQDCRKQKLTPSSFSVWPDLPPEHSEKLSLPQCEGRDTILSEKVKVDTYFQNYFCMSAVVDNIWPGAWQPWHY